MPDMSPGERSAVAGPLAGAVVLVIDDGAADVALMKFFLQRSGATVVEAASGAKGLIAVAKRSGESPIDVVVCDLQMPGIDGLETTRLIREDGYDGPIVAVSASATEADLRRWLASGADTFLAKPFSEEDFRETLVDALRRSRLRELDRVGS